MRVSRVGGAAVGLLMALTGCGGEPDSLPGAAGTDSIADSPSREPRTASSPEHDGRSGAAKPAGDGTALRVDLRTHCGVRSIVVDGKLWLADPPLGDHNPPRGWDENRVAGSFTRLGDRRAEFRGDQGERASFRRAAAGTVDPAQDCE